jgi:dihydrofolate reductase
MEDDDAVPQKRLAVIVACTPEGGFASNNSIPWVIKRDMSFFRTTTLQTTRTRFQNAVIMGRTTWETLPPSHRPLPNRLNIVISSTLSPPIPCASVVILPSLSAALELTQGLPKIETTFVIGGQRLYEEALALPQLSTVYLTLVRADPSTHIPRCDRHFPLTTLYRQFAVKSSNTYTEGPYMIEFVQCERTPTPTLI